MPKRFVIIIGIILMAIGNFFVGTSEIFGAENDSDMILLGLCFIGLAAAIMTIPVLPEMLESIEHCQDETYDPEELNNVISGLFVTSTGLGETVGPILASVLVEIYDFRSSQELYATALLCYAALYLVITFVLFPTPPPQDIHIEMTEEDAVVEIVKA
jgi:MFS family permease